MRSRRQATDVRGFSLVEVLVAVGVLAAAVLSVVQLFATATAATASARDTGEAAVLAWQKVEQLRSLAFGTDDAGLPITDTTTDLAAAPERPVGGPGLGGSPAGVLARDTSGHVDYLDAWAQSLGGGGAGGAQPPPGTRYRRRWAVEPAGGPVAGLLVIRVRVLGAGREVEYASLVTLRSRKSP
jgi:prepilin-type N-terminal cleavage/methylation domain-containing protein